MPNLTAEERNAHNRSIVRSIDIIRASQQWLTTYVNRCYEDRVAMDDEQLAAVAQEFTDLADALTRLVRRG